jgi:hypothetical protein
MAFAVGELQITRGPLSQCSEGHLFHADWLRIDRADPLVFVARELLADLLIWRGGRHFDLQPGPGAVVTPRGICVSGVEWASIAAGALTGWLLTVRAVNRTVLYRIGEKAVSHDGYLAEWPD